MVEDIAPAGETRCGTVAILGKPNAGKSALLNALVGQKLAIVSPKPQATRQPVIGLHTEGAVQVVLVDQPGLLDPRYLLHEAMMAAAMEWMMRADALLYLIAVNEPAPAPLIDLLPEAFRPIEKPTALLVTKTDELTHRAAWEDEMAGRYATFIRTSAESGHGLRDVIAWTRAQVPERDFLYDADDASAQPLRFFVTEFVREAAFELLHEELPYALVPEVDEFREGSDPLYIRVTIYIEQDSQKRMVIGKGGRTIKALGRRARQKIEALVAQRIFLDLWVKTLPKWRSDPGQLRRFGLPAAEKERV